MTELKGKLIMTYRWWRANGEKISAEHVKALKEDAKDRINEMVDEGYTSGELHTNFVKGGRVDGDATEYTGWWESSEE